jgi:hypothetical protein
MTQVSEASTSAAKRPTMQFTIVDKQIRIFGAAIAFLAKCGKEISMEGSEESVSLMCPPCLFVVAV